MDSFTHYYKDSNLFLRIDWGKWHFYSKFYSVRLFSTYLLPAFLPSDLLWVSFPHRLAFTTGAQQLGGLDYRSPH